MIDSVEDPVIQESIQCSVHLYAKFLVPPNSLMTWWCVFDQETSLNSSLLIRPEVVSKITTSTMLSCFRMEDFSENFRLSWSRLNHQGHPGVP